MSAAAHVKDEEKEKLRRRREGVVVSDKMNKTRVVEVVRMAQHPIYKKIVRTSKKYYAHDENNESKVGDTVRMIETRPMSKLKRWRVVEVVKQ
jgi:small subunit ribosomal protein S17